MTSAEGPVRRDAGLRGRRLTRRGLAAAAAGVGLLLSNRITGAAPGRRGFDLTRFQEASPEPSNLPDFSGKTLNFMIIQPHVVTGDLLKADFEQLTGATVNLTSVPYDQVQAKATLDVQSGANEFDVFDYWYPTLGAMATQGIVEDVTDFIANDPDIDPADFIPTIYDVYTLFDGRRWGLPYDGDAHVLFYNTEIFGRHNLTAPETWDDVLNAARTITEAESADGIYGIGIMGFKVPIILGSTYANRLAGFGGTFLDADGNPTLDSEAAIQAAVALNDIAAYALPTPLETAFEQSLPAFSGGTTAMQEFWTDLGVYAQSSEGTEVADKWDVVQMPVGGANTTHVAPLNAGFAFAVSAGSTEKEMARQFVKYATSKAFHVKALTTVGSGIDPMRVSGLDSEAYKAFAPKVQAAVAAFGGVLPWPTIPRSPDLMTRLTDELALMLQGNKSPEEAMNAAQEGWQEILGT
ncbi:MAG: ABC transporter substrate-binding protein [Thermomicrobiales bacterium]